MNQKYFHPRWNSLVTVVFFLGLSLISFQQKSYANRGTCISYLPAETTSTDPVSAITLSGVTTTDDGYIEGYPYVIEMASTRLVSYLLQICLWMVKPGRYFLWGWTAPHLLIVVLLVTGETWKTNMTAFLAHRRLIMDSPPLKSHHVKKWPWSGRGSHHHL